MREDEGEGRGWRGRERMEGRGEDGGEGRRLEEDGGEGRRLEEDGGEGRRLEEDGGEEGV